MPDVLRTHDVYLRDGPLHLRPLTEDDWPLLLRWNNDPEVLYFVEGGQINAWLLGDMQAMYRAVSQRALCFLALLDRRPIGECWLQEMNLERVRRAFPGRDVRRIDLMIGEKALWGRGWGTRMVRLLVRHAFEVEEVDLLYEPEIMGHNPRSRWAFDRAGFLLCGEVPQPPGAKAPVAYDLILTRERYRQLTEPHRSAGPQDGGISAEGALC